MHTLGVKKEDDIKKLAIFWVTGPIKFTVLEYNTYKSWNVKVDCEIDVLDELKNYLKTKGILGQDWKKVDDPWRSISLIKSHVKNLIEFIDKGDKKEWMESLCDAEKFLFTYNGIANSNPNSGHNIK